MQPSVGKIRPALSTIATPASWLTEAPVFLAIGRRDGVGILASRLDRRRNLGRRELGERSNERVRRIDNDSAYGGHPRNPDRDDAACSPFRGNCPVA
jgi:hypothetical protein